MINRYTTYFYITNRRRRNRRNLVGKKEKNKGKRKLEEHEINRMHLRAIERPGGPQATAGYRRCHHRYM